MNKNIAQSSLIKPVIIIALGLFALFYNKLLFANFVSWDDGEVLVQNKDVHDFAVKAFFTKQYVGNYAPVTMLGFALDWLIFKGNPIWHHLINILLHFVNVFLVYRLCYFIFKENTKALFCAIVFCFHPFQIETIAWISAKNNLVYSVFFLSSLLFYAHYLTTALKKYYLFTMAFFVLSLLSKPSAVTFPFCLLLLEYLVNKRIVIKPFIIKIAPFLLLSIAIGIVTLYTRSEADFLDTQKHFAFYEKIGYAGFALVFYLSKFILPVNLSVIYPYPENGLLSICIGYAFLVLLGFGLYKLHKQQKNIVSFGLIFFVANLILVLQLIPFGQTLTADRYMYLPIIGLSIGLVYFIPFSVGKSQLVMLTVVAFLLGFLSFKRINVWQNSISLYSDILKKHPNSYEALNGLGTEYMLKKDYSNAAQFLNKAIVQNSNYYKPFYNRGLLYARNKNFEQAIADFTKAIELNKYSKAYTARAAAYFELNEIDKAMQDAEMALKNNATNGNTYYVLANCYNQKNELDKALAHYNKAIEYTSEDGEIYLKRAILFGKKQNFTACISDLNSAIYYNPNAPEAYYWRGVAKFNIKQNPCSDLLQAQKLGYPMAQQAINSYCK